MPVVTCVCNECGNHFYTKDSYVFVDKNNIRRINNKEMKSPSTWEEWILHCITFCEECRIKSIPTSCLQNNINQDIIG